MKIITIMIMVIIMWYSY